MMSMRNALLVLLLIVPLMLCGCFEDDEGEEEEELSHPDIDRRSRIPADAVKVTPESDLYPPILHSDLYEDPVPMDAHINTAGGEDSPFILPDGETFYFFFTPDVNVPPEEQVSDEVTGLYMAIRNGSGWTEPERVWLQDPGKLALDGAAYVDDDEIWFASAREGYTGVNLFLADPSGEGWTNWRFSGDQLKDYMAGEMHMAGDTMYFHSGREGGKGGLDIWTTTRDGESWSEPLNIEAVNTAEMDGFPYISQDGNEMWFTRTYMGSPAIFMSEKVNGTWVEPVLVLSQFAGEPTLDNDGNIYFAHHYFEDGVMIEADLYVAHRK